MKKGQIGTIFLILGILIVGALLVNFLVKPNNNQCVPSCTNKTCGNNGCGGVCGTCSSTQTCSSGKCVITQNETQCVPSCTGKICGSDGCTGSCGTCSSTQTCSSGSCINETPQEGTITLNGREFIFKKPSSGSNFPVIIVLHGGGQSADAWFSSNEQSQFVTDALADGYAIIAPNSGSPIYSSCTIQTKQWYYEKDWATLDDYDFFNEIFSWINSNQDLNSNRVYATGISSGGFMSSRLARSFGTSKLKAIAVHSSGDADSITHGDQSDLKLCTFGTGGTIPDACGPTFNNIDSPINTNHPPTLIIHGTYDGMVPVASGEHYYDELNSAGIQVTKFIKTTGGITACHSWFSESSQKILDWFGKYT